VFGNRKDPQDPPSLNLVNGTLDANLRDDETREPFAGLARMDSFY